ncbi:MAG: hypothetical protein ACP5SC_07890, partial [Desulfurella sp.]
MSENRAKKLVKDTLEASFSEEQFKNLMIELLKDDFDLSKTFSCQGNYIPANFKEYIISYKHLGQFKTDKKEIIDVLVVKLKSETT